MDAGALDDVADIDPHSELKPPLLRNLRISLGHPAFNLNGATQRVDDARKQDQHSVAGRPYDPAAVFLDFGLNELTVMSVQLSERALVVSTYQAAVADHIGHKDGRQPPFHTLARQGCPPRRQFTRLRLRGPRDDRCCFGAPRRPAARSPRRNRLASVSSTLSRRPTRSLAKRPSVMPPR